MLKDLSCLVDSDCPFQYSCSDSLCQHIPMFPLELYPCIIYALIPFAMTVCNIGGLSGGIFKVVFLMDLLNYPASQATTLAYSMITGAAFANFLLLIPRRHPMMDAPLVDHLLVFLLVPCILTGTTMGVIIGKSLNDLTEDILVVIVCLYFAFKYFKRFRHRKRVERGLSIDSRVGLLELNRDSSRESVDEVSEERKQFDKEQSGYHAKQIILSIVFFLALQIINATCQGKIFIKFSKCTLPYFLFFGGYLVFMAMIIGAAYKLAKLRMAKYKRINFHYILQLDQFSVYIKIVGGGIVAGLLQGIIGMGSGHMISLVLLSMEFRPEVTSGTSGYIIFFVGSASMIEAFVLGDASLNESGLLFGVSFVGSFILTFFTRRYLKKRAQLDTTIIFILAMICVVSILGVIGNVIQTTLTFGFEHMLAGHSLCS